MNIRFYIDPDTNLPHILGIMLKKMKLRMFCRVQAKIDKDVKTREWLAVK